MKETDNRKILEKSIQLVCRIDNATANAEISVKRNVQSLYDLLMKLKK